MTNLPVTGKFSVTAVFGQTGSMWKNGHKGIDLVAQNKDIYSTCDGVVRVVAYDPGGWGNYISIGDSKGNKHIFCHLEKTYVKPGNIVTRLSVIGKMGSTGNSSGVHLHYQLNSAADVAQNPANYLGIPNKKGNYNSEDYTIMEYKDQNEIAAWAKSAVQKVTELGIMQGDNNGNFNPKQNITRQEVAVIISNLLEKE